MRTIMIVGAGQSGLQLALSLQKKGYRVTVTSNRSADDIRTGKVLSSQCMFHDSLQHERGRGLVIDRQLVRVVVRHDRRARLAGPDVVSADHQGDVDLLAGHRRQPRLERRALGRPGCVRPHGLVHGWRDLAMPIERGV